MESKKLIFGEWRIEFDDEQKRFAIIRNGRWVCSYESLRGSIFFLSQYLGIPYKELKKNLQ